MKKIFLLVSCLAVMASCSKKAENNAAEAAQQVEATATQSAEAVAETATNAAEAVANLFAEADKIGAKAFGLRQDESGKWILNLKNTNENGDAAGDLLKIEIADDAEIVALGQTVACSALNDEVKSLLNNKMVGYWLNGDGKISHIIEVAQ